MCSSAKCLPAQTWSVLRYVDMENISNERKDIIRSSVDCFCLMFFIVCRLIPPTLSSCHQVIFALGMWCAGLPNILNPDSSLALDPDNKIQNHNLFFASWAAFVTMMSMFVGMIPKLMGERGDSPFMPHWMGMGTASLIVMTNAVRVWRDECDIDDESKFCRRDLFGFILGALGGFFSILFMVFHHEMLERGMSVLFFVAWCLGIAYLTFLSGAATSTGTYYFAVWAAFLFSLNMAVTSLMSFYDKQFGGCETADAGGDDVAPGDGSKNAAAQEETAKQEVEEDHDKDEAGQAVEPA